MLHCYYVDELPRIKSYLRNIPFEFAVIVSTDTVGKKAAIEQAFSGWRYGPVEITIVKNHGRDIAPRFVDLRDTYAQFDYVLHIHTKKSLHTDWLRDWSSELLGDLLDSRQSVLGIFEIFHNAPDIGVIAPRYFEPIRRYCQIGVNFPHCEALARRLGFHLQADDPIEFPAGSMFWARSAALRPLLDLKLRHDEFEPEQGQSDGTLAHALERMIFYSSEVAGYGWCFVGQGRKATRSQKPITIESRSEITNAVRETTRTLIPTRTVTEIDALKTRFRRRLIARLATFLAGSKRIVLRTSENPEVSVVLVLYNGAELSFEHLSSLEFALSVPSEVIIIDNNSTDLTHRLLDRVDGARLIFNSENLHFLRAVNQGVQASRGKYILLLNNDTSIKPTAITIARDLIMQDAMIGAVGGKLILIDGTLQEAGSITLE